ncbi:MAG: hypothetical protein ACSLE8_06185 [Rhodococcus sp. (in: high G+C Gram-positive bacteria)]
MSPTIEEVTGKAEDLDVISYNRLGEIECSTGEHFAAKLTVLCQAFYDRGARDMFDQFELVEVWHVRGLPHVMFDTKIEAETAARFWFPHENIDQRYSRLSYSTLFQEKP